MPSWTDIGESSEVGERKGKAFFVEDTRLAVFRHEGRLYALDEMCTHAEASLAFGHLEDGCVACPWHYAQFDLETGEPRSLPAVKGVSTHAIRETDDGRIEVSLGEG